MPDPSEEKQVAFLVAVRKLEKEHGVYIHTSEWIYLSDQAPDDPTGLQSAGSSEDVNAKVKAALDNPVRLHPDGRDYLTPEDCEAARDAGMNTLDLYRALLTWIAVNGVEDPKLCCYVVTAPKD